MGYIGIGEAAIGCTGVEETEMDCNEVDYIQHRLVMDCCSSGFAEGCKNAENEQDLAEVQEAVEGMAVLQT
jgi:hypothetical protein